MPALELRATENKMKNDHLELQDTSPDSSSNGSFTGLSNSSMYLFILFFYFITYH